MTRSIYSLRQQLAARFERYHRRLLRLPALLVDVEGTGTAAVESRPGYVYYKRAEDEGMYGICLNRRVPPTPNQAVFIGYDIHQPQILQVLSIRNVYGGTGSTTPANLPHHHEMHEFGSDDGGNDVVWVQQQQVVPLLVCPDDPEAMTVEIRGGIYAYADGVKYFDSTTSADLSSYQPSAGTVAKFVLLTIDVDSNALQYTEGDAFGITSTPSDIWQYIPDLPDLSVPLAAVILTSSMTSIGWDEIYDVRALNRSVRDQADIDTILEALPLLENAIDLQMTLHLMQDH